MFSLSFVEIDPQERLALPSITLSAKQVLVGKLCGERPGFAKARWLIHVPEHNCIEIVDGTFDKDERIAVLKRGREIVEVGPEEFRNVLLIYAVIRPGSPG